MKLHIPRYGSENEVLGLKTKSITISNSERSTAACPLRWLFAYSERLRPKRKAMPLLFGSAFHECVEEVHTWWKRFDSTYEGDGRTCVLCGGSGCDLCSHTGEGPISRAEKAWMDLAQESQVTGEGDYSYSRAKSDVQRLERAFVGWLRVYGRKPDPEMRVLAAEIKMAVPILSPTGRVYAPKTWLVQEEGGFRMAGPGEAHLATAKAVRWPYYQTLTIDAVYQHRDNGSLYLYELKTSSSPERKLQTVSVDPQIAGYTWALRSLVRQGLVEGVPKNTKVNGYIYDIVSSSKQKDPELLKAQKVKAIHPDTGLPYKDGSRWVYIVNERGVPIERSPGLSRNKGAGVPSWIYREAVKAHGFDMEEYEDHLLELMSTIDRRLYLRDIATSGYEISDRYGREIYGVAQQLATWKRKAAEMQTPQDRDLLFPRQPVCTAGQGCPYRGPCLQDGELVRNDFMRADTLRWVTIPEAQEEAPTNPEEALGW